MALVLAQLLAQTQSQPVQEAQQPPSFLDIFLYVSGLLENLAQ